MVLTSEVWFVYGLFSYGCRGLLLPLGPQCVRVTLPAYPHWDEMARTFRGLLHVELRVELPEPSLKSTITLVAAQAPEVLGEGELEVRPVAGLTPLDREAWHRFLAPRGVVPSLEESL